MPPASTGRRERFRPVPIFEARLIASDEPGAWEVLEAALGSGMEPEEVLLEIVVPTMRSIGVLWEKGELTVADEHRASSVATRLDKPAWCALWSSRPQAGHGDPCCATG